MSTWQPVVLSSAAPAQSPSSTSGATHRLWSALGRVRRWLQPRRGFVLRSAGRLLLAALIFYALGPLVGGLCALLLWFAQSQCDGPNPPPPPAPPRLRAL